MNRKEIIRTKYLEKLLNWNEARFIKILTGIRGSGKLTILNQYKELLQRKRQVRDEQFIIYDFNDEKLAEETTWDTLTEKIEEKSLENSVNYVFLNQIQEVWEFENCLITLFENKKYTYDIYVTSSDAELLSSQLATLLTGRHKDFGIYPLSFTEIQNEFKLSEDKLYYRYLVYGGLGPIASYYEDSGNDEYLQHVLNYLFDDTVEIDLINRYRLNIKNLMREIIEYIYNNIGVVVPTIKLENYLNFELKYKITAKTIDKYLNCACEALVLHRVNYYDFSIKRVLKTTGKYYAGDLGLLSAKIGFNENKNKEYRLENLVLLHLLSLGYEVSTLKNRDGGEVDFVCFKNEKVIYIQVTLELNDDNYEREVGNLLSIRDAFPKVVIYKTCLETHFGDGVVRINIFDFLKEGLSPKLLFDDAY
ncbi:MAG: ATP-binding protein [Mycoplasmataceae bacterium]|nr:ATP-binding protein [Mycoplasmataceae bacterium]